MPWTTQFRTNHLSQSQSPYRQSQWCGGFIERPRDSTLSKGYRKHPTTFEFKVLNLSHQIDDTHISFLTSSHFLTPSQKLKTPLSWKGQNSARTYPCDPSVGSDRRCSRWPSFLGPIFPVPASLTCACDVEKSSGCNLQQNSRIWLHR